MAERAGARIADVEEARAVGSGSGRAGAGSRVWEGGGGGGEGNEIRFGFGAADAEFGKASPVPNLGVWRTARARGCLGLGLNGPSRVLVPWLVVVDCIE